MQPQITIREFYEADMDSVLALWGCLLEHHRSLDTELYALRSEARITYERWLHRRFKEDQAQMWIAELDGQLLGYVMAMVGYRSPVYAVHRVGMLCDLVVAPSQRRLGVGTQLATHAMFAFLNEGISTIQVNYDHENAEAAQFWTKLGFEPRLFEAYRQLTGAEFDDFLRTKDWKGENT